MLHQHPQEVWGSITSSCFSAFPFFSQVRGQGRSEECYCQPKRPEPDPQICPGAYIHINFTWNLVTKHTLLWFQVSVLLQGTARKQIPLTAAGISVLKQYKKRELPAWSVPVKQAGSPPHPAHLWRPVQCTGRQLHPWSVLHGRTRAVSGCSISFQCLLFFFFPQKEENLLDRDFSLGNSGF